MFSDIDIAQIYPFELFIIISLIGITAKVFKIDNSRLAKITSANNYAIILGALSFWFLDFDGFLFAYNIEMFAFYKRQGMLFYIILQIIIAYILPLCFLLFLKKSFRCKIYIQCFLLLIALLLHYEIFILQFLANFIELPLFNEFEFSIFLIYASPLEFIIGLSLLFVFYYLINKNILPSCNIIENKKIDEKILDDEFHNSK